MQRPTILEFLINDNLVHQTAPLPCPGGVKNTALPSAVSTLCSARPIRSFPPRDRIRYLASDCRHATNIPLILSTFFAMTWGQKYMYIIYSLHRNTLGIEDIILKSLSMWYRDSDFQTKGFKTPNNIFTHAVQYPVRRVKKSMGT